MNDKELIDIELPIEVAAKVKYAMEKRGLRFPEDISCWLDEVAKPDGDEFPEFL